MVGAGKARHVRADRRDERRGGHGSGRRQAEQQLHGLFLLGHEVGDAPLQSMDALLQIVDVVKQLLPNELPMVGVDAPGQGQPQSG